MCRTGLATLAFCFCLLGCSGQAALTSTNAPRFWFMTTSCLVTLPSWSQMERQIAKEISSLEIWVTQNDDVQHAMGAPLRTEAECAFYAKDRVDQAFCNIRFFSTRKVAVVIFVNGRKEPDYCQPITVTCQGSAPLVTKPRMAVNAIGPSSVCWHPLN